MVNDLTQELVSTADIDEPAMADEELKRLAAVFDVLIDVDFLLNYTKVAVS